MRLGRVHTHTHTHSFSLFFPAGRVLEEMFSASSHFQILQEPQAHWPLSWEENRRLSLFQWGGRGLCRDTTEAPLLPLSASWSLHLPGEGFSREGEGGRQSEGGWGLRRACPVLTLSLICTVQAHSRPSINIRWIDGWMDARRDGERDGWMGGWMNGWVGRREGSWTDGRIDRREGWVGGQVVRT